MNDYCRLLETDKSPTYTENTIGLRYDKQKNIV